MQAVLHTYVAGDVARRLPCGNSTVTNNTGRCCRGTARYEVVAVLTNPRLTRMSRHVIRACFDMGVPALVDRVDF